MKRIVFSILLAIVLVLALRAGLVVNAASSLAHHDVVAPAEQLIGALQQYTFTVSCGPRTISGDCEALCYAVGGMLEGETILGAWYSQEINAAKSPTEVYPILSHDHGWVDIPCWPTLNNATHSIQWTDSACDPEGLYWRYAGARGTIVYSMTEPPSAPCLVVYTANGPDDAGFTDSGGQSQYDAWSPGTSPPSEGEGVCIDNGCDLDCVDYCPDCYETSGYVQANHWHCDGQQCWWDMYWGYGPGGSGSTENTDILFVFGDEVSVVSTSTVTYDPCVISQTILFDDYAPVVGRETENNDWTPLGLEPFVNGTFQSLYPISSTVVVYEIEADCRSGVTPPEGEGYCEQWSLPTFDDPEYHIVVWKSISFTLPFSVPNCIVPEFPGESGCPEPDWAHWTYGNWISWLWCNQSSLFVGLAEWATYLLCVSHQVQATIGNGMAEYLWNISIDVGDYFSQLTHLLVSYFTQNSRFIIMLATEFPLWLWEMLVCFYNYVDAVDDSGADFIIMAVYESAVWLNDLLLWVAVDVVPTSVGAVLDVMAIAINNSGQIMQFLVNQFVATLDDVIDLLGIVIGMISFVIELLADLIAGLKAALDSDTTQDLFQTTAPYFWRGLQFFEDTVSETPLLLLNLAAIGFMAVNLLFWTIGQVSGLVDDLMQI